MRIFVRDDSRLRLLGARKLHDAKLRWHQLHKRRARLRLQAGLRQMPALPFWQVARLCRPLEQALQFLLAAAELRMHDFGCSAALFGKAGG